MVTPDGAGGKDDRPPLLDHHAAELRASGLSDAQVRAAGVYSETDPGAVAALLNGKHPAVALGPCLCFPFPAAGDAPYAAVKPDRSRVKGEKPVKYESPVGRPLRAYVPPGTRAALADPTAPLVLTEGVKKALKADQEGFPCVGLAGVYGWCKKRAAGADGKKAGPRALIPDLAAVAWRGREVTILFDSDAATNPNVRGAERYLRQVLTAAGAVVAVARLEPTTDGAKVGLDDYLLTHTPDDLRALIAAAHTPTGTNTGTGAAGDQKEDAKPPAVEVLTAIGLEFDLWHDATQAAFATRAGRVYLHLGDAEAAVVEIDADGWRACPDPPVRFRKPAGMLPLPVPERRGRLADLRAFLNVPDDDAFALVGAWLAGCFRPAGPFPALVLLGEQGSAKTTTGRVVKRLLDPAAAGVRCEPKEARDLMIQARNGWALCFDNLSHLPVWLSDALCRLATGGGFSTRELYTDDGEVIFDAKRPLVVNGIEDFVTRADLLERSLRIRHPPIPEDKRRPEDAFWAAFDAAHPKLLGALLDHVAGGLRELPGTTLARLPRMADFARFAVACERGAGDKARFLSAYADNQAGAHEQALDAPPLPAAVVKLMAGREVWEGAPTELLKELATLAENPEPKGANALTNRLRRLAPNLRRVHGLDVADGREPGARSAGKRSRFVRVTRTAGSGRDGPSPPSPDATEPTNARDSGDSAGDDPGGRCSADSVGTVHRDRPPSDAGKSCGAAPPTAVGGRWGRSVPPALGSAVRQRRPRVRHGGRPMVTATQPAPPAALTARDLLPADPDLTEKDGKPHVRVRERGKAVLYPLTEDGRQYLKPAAKWAADVRFADGRRKRVRFSPNRDASAVMLADLLKKIENQKAGVRDQYADHRASRLGDLLKQYEQHVLDKEATAKEAAQAARRCEIAFEAVGFLTLRDLDATAAERWLADRRQLAKSDGGFGPATSNHYRKSLVAFGNWLVRTRRSPENPFRFIPKANANLDVRHQRRPLTAEEFGLLVSAARSGCEFRGLCGPDRAALYTVAGMTGLRAGELASLSPHSFALDGDPPVVVVEAAYSKHRRRDEVPLHPELIGELRAWLADKPGDEPLWPGNWAKHTAAVDLIKRDLERARAAWIGEATDAQEKRRREASDFLAYRNREGHVADFHSLRHTFVTNLVNAGTAPKDAKELARHSTITLTMDRYAHVGIRSTATAVAKLKLPIPPRSDDGTPDAQTRGRTERHNSGAATGAAEGEDGRERMSGFEKSGSAGGPTNSLDFQAKDAKREQSRTEEEVCPTGVEPVTFGSGGQSRKVRFIHRSVPKRLVL